jgi:hypothetical protein
MEFSSLLPKALFDPYDRPARLYPGLLALMPIPVVLVCLYGSSHPWTTGTLSILSFCGGGYLLGRISRDAGIRLQDGLFTKWGGAPTTQVLRFRDLTFDAHTKERYHAVLSKGIGKSLPTAEQEASDPAAADELYRAATAWLKEQRRDTKKFPLIFKENIAFGFQRNSLGIRRYGVFVAIGCTIWVLFHAGVLNWTAPFLATRQLRALESAETLALAICIVILFIWLAFLTEDAVKRTGFAYAERLFQSCEDASAPPSVARARQRRRSSQV